MVDDLVSRLDELVHVKRDRPQSRESHRHPAPQRRQQIVAQRTVAHRLATCVTVERLPGIPRSLVSRPKSRAEARRRRSARRRGPRWSRSTTSPKITVGSGSARTAANELARHSISHRPPRVAGDRPSTSWRYSSA